MTRSHKTRPTPPVPWVSEQKRSAKRTQEIVPHRCQKFMSCNKLQAYPFLKHARKPKNEPKHPDQH